MSAVMINKEQERLNTEMVRKTAVLNYTQTGYNWDAGC